MTAILLALLALLAGCAAPLPAPAPAGTPGAATTGPLPRPPARGPGHLPQGVDYRIEARLDEATDVLGGRARLRYTNRAAATLDTLWLHQHLNAFRPNSAWARRELEYGVRRFQDLRPGEHAYERFTRVEVDGQPVVPVYPGAPDSTVVGIPLPRGLPTGETAVVTMDWDARLSALPRRQGRAGRHYDFAQWYPRIAVFDGRWQTQPLLPQGEFFGEFGSYDVTLDVAADQVLGATGVPVEGDPGWRVGAVTRPFDETLLRRGAYPARAAEPLGLLAAAPPAGRKRVRWRAEEVHNFAWSANPTFRYESATTARAGGGPPPVAVHVLYWPADVEWRDTARVRTVRALDYMQELFGPYPWPQLTNLRRLESGGTEFPMLVMNGSASEGLIVHEVAHQYLHGILANNEWREAHMDEGFASFVSNWYFEDRGAPDPWPAAMESVRRLEQAGRTQPIALPSAEFVDPATYTAMTYTKASLVFRMLREMVGHDTMRRILRTYYERHRLQHVTEADFQRVAEEVTGQDLDWFFRQWFHTTAQLDYGIAAARTQRADDGRWRTTVEVVRAGDAWMPVVLRVGEERRALTSRERRQTVEIVTDQRPADVVLDPDNALLDVDPGNQRRPL
jgi:hypothetical protein